MRNVICVLARDLSLNNIPQTIYCNDCLIRSSWNVYTSRIHSRKNKPMKQLSGNVSILWWVGFFLEIITADWNTRNNRPLEQLLKHTTDRPFLFLRKCVDNCCWTFATQEKSMGAIPSEVEHFHVNRSTRWSGPNEANTIVCSCWKRSISDKCEVSYLNGASVLLWFFSIISVILRCCLSYQHFSEMCST